MEIVIRITGLLDGELWEEEYLWPDHTFLILPAVGDSIDTNHGMLIVTARSFTYETDPGPNFPIQLLRPSSTSDENQTSTLQS